MIIHSIWKSKLLYLFSFNITDLFIIYNLFTIHENFTDNTKNLFSIKNDSTLVIDEGLPKIISETYPHLVKNLISYRSHAQIWASYHVLKI